LSQLKIIEFQNKIVTDEINTNEDLAIPPDSYRDPTKTILSTYEIAITKFVAIENYQIPK
jgi:hypothetical protein